MSHIDRLSALMDRFELTVTPAQADQANLVISALKDDRWLLRLAAADGVLLADPADRTGFCAHVSWGASDNPLFSALPPVIERQIAGGDDLALLVRLLLSEWRGQRCGVASVINRLGEVLIVRIVREAIEGGSTEPNVLGGLADPRLSRAIVAVHETPGAAWQIEDLASIAGLSRSRFAELFHHAVGQTPLAYVRNWRLSLAHQDLVRGDRIQRVAARYGYGSGEALNRAIRRRFGISPTEIKRRAQMTA